MDSNMCKTKFCRNRAKGYCHTCLSRRKRERNPIRYAYDTLKQNCKRRKGAGWFELTFEEFKQFAIETDYVSKKGVTKKSYTIDCKDQTMGYFIGNIRVVSQSENSRKRRMSLLYEYVPEVGRMVATLKNNYNDKIYCSEQDR